MVFMSRLDFIRFILLGVLELRNGCYLCLRIVLIHGLTVNVLS